MLITINNEVSFDADSVEQIIEKNNTHDIITVSPKRYAAAMDFEAIKNTLLNYPLSDVRITAGAYDAVKSYAGVISIKITVTDEGTWLTADLLPAAPAPANYEEASAEENPFSDFEIVTEDDESAVEEQSAPAEGSSEQKNVAAEEKPAKATRKKSRRK
ncbi:MAG: hypothetical protein J6Y89_06680 [Lachnospiraceae bacterium]|nr:hypothetical protein [Lachnospiraceae bacterium]